MQIPLWSLPQRKVLEAKGERSIELKHTNVPFLGTNWLTVGNFMGFYLKSPSGKGGEGVKPFKVCLWQEVGVGKVVESEVGLQGRSLSVPHHGGGGIEQENGPGK